MTSDGQTGAGDADAPFAAPAPKRKRRRGVNYPLMVAGFAVVCAAGFWGFYKYSPHASLLASIQGVPSKEEAYTCLENHDYPCAEADYYAYLKQYPNDAPATAILAITLTKDGQHKEALHYYKKALALGVATYDLYAGYAASLAAIGDIDGAIKMNYASLQLAPTLVDVRGTLADQLVQKGRGQEALTLLTNFDRQLEDEGQPDYFAAQIARIKTRLGGGAGPAPGAGAAQQLAANEDHGAAAAGVSEIPLQAADGALYVPAIVDGDLHLRFVIDSGATQVCIPGEVARTLMQQGKIGASDYLGQGYAILADGSRVPARLFRLHSLQVGDHVLHNVTATITPGGGPLLLGQSFLKRFKSWSIDNHRRVLMLEG